MMVVHNIIISTMIKTSDYTLYSTHAQMTPPPVYTSCDHSPDMPDVHYVHRKKKIKNNFNIKYK